MTMPKFEPACYWIKDAEQFHIGLKPFALAWKPLYTADQLAEAHEAGKRDATWCKDQINANDVEYVRADIAEAELAATRAEIAKLHDQLAAEQAKNARLREALEHSVRYVPELATVPGIAAALSATPGQSLARIRNQVRTECAELIQDQGLAGKNLAYMILDMKEPE